MVEIYYEIQIEAYPGKWVKVNAYDNTMQAHAISRMEFMQGKNPESNFRLLQRTITTEEEIVEVNDDKS